MVVVASSHPGPPRSSSCGPINVALNSTMWRWKVRPRIAACSARTRVSPPGSKPFVRRGPSGQTAAPRTNRGISCSGLRPTPPAAARFEGRRHTPWKSELLDDRPPLDPMRLDFSERARRSGNRRSELAGSDEGRLIAAGCRGDPDGCSAPGAATNRGIAGTFRYRRAGGMQLLARSIAATDGPCRP